LRSRCRVSTTLPSTTFSRPPPEVIAALNAAINHVLMEPRVRERDAALGAEPVGGAPEAVAATVREEIARWRAVIVAQGLAAQ
jgi:tripartite-type tricarboxylate transporter receptor subunit TctC